MCVCVCVCVCVCPCTASASGLVIIALALRLLRHIYAAASGVIYPNQSGTSPTSRALSQMAHTCSLPRSGTTPTSRALPQRVGHYPNQLGTTPTSRALPQPVGHYPDWFHEVLHSVKTVSFCFSAIILLDLFVLQFTERDLTQ